MEKSGFQEVVEMPNNCTPSIEKGKITIKGEKGEVERILFNPAFSFKIDDNKIIISTKSNNKKSKAVINTYKAHIKNLVIGASEGYIYKLKICSGHFPMTVNVKDSVFEIKNFIGERVPRTIKILDGTTVKVEGVEVVVESLDKEKAGQMAASIEQLTRRPGFDKRIFQDGIYIIEKAGKTIK